MTPHVKFMRRAIAHIDGKVIRKLKKDADRASGKRSRLCFHLSTVDQVQEMVIAFRKGTYSRPHRHLDICESFHVIEGEMALIIFGANGSVRKAIEMGNVDSGKTFYLRLNKSLWHMIIPRSKYVIVHETKQGPFSREEQIYPSWAPDDSDHDRAALFLQDLTEELVTK